MDLNHVWEEEKGEGGKGGGGGEGGGGEEEKGEGKCTCIHVLMRDEKEDRKKQARSNKQTRQSNTAHPKQSLFLEKNELPRVGLDPTTCTWVSLFIRCTMRCEIWAQPAELPR